MKNQCHSKLRLLVSLCVLVFMPHAFAAGADVVVKMRNSGYTMGDFIEMQVDISLPDNQILDNESLLLEGRIKPWLDLRKLKIYNRYDKKNKVRLDFTWQVFATVEIAQVLKLPEIALKTLPDSNKKQTSIIIPAQSFQYSPVFAYPLGDVKRQSDLPPLRFNEARHLLLAVIMLAGASLCAFVWAYLHDLLHWLPRNPGPITQLIRQFKRKKLTSLQAQDLQAIHSALNESAGCTLYPQTLKTLFKNAPYLTMQQASITQFFNQSWQQFYALDTVEISEIKLQETLQWMNQAALSERLFRRYSLKNKKNLFKPKAEKTAKPKPSAQKLA